METKKIIASAIIIWALWVSGLTYAANTTNSWTTATWVKNTFKEFSKNFWEERGWKKGHRWGMWWEMWGGFGMMWVKMKTELTTEEKTKLESMTDEEKKAFFEAKRTEAEAKMTAREAVIDKLLNGETLTDSEKAIVTEIKKDRAEAKAKKLKWMKWEN